ncbi:hypothetical protein DPMN_190188 [Dreissena polymorpha]|uniref:Uncharacterized protein n=1 Tax=Dreissena polymorpha TaxID=45954 RepID=A0A9D4DTC8_DREPO|nr:hypothetical protein DPMN_190188 [Dreissena polymorpha]
MTWVTSGVLGDLAHLGCLGLLGSPRVSWVTWVTSGVFVDLGHLGCLTPIATSLQCLPSASRMEDNRSV